MARNRFERVEQAQADAITLSLTKRDGKDLGVVIFPAAATKGRFSEDRISEPLAPRESFRSAIRLANEMKLAIVVLDPDNLWDNEWGELYVPID
jgi:hypothetical protein